MALRVVALVAAFNEERFIGNCLEHLTGHGVAVHLIDNGSSDATAAVASRFLGRGLSAIESFPRDGHYRWEAILRRKEELAATLDADWYVNVDADEIHLPPGGRGRLADALTAADAAGFTAVEFTEFTFVPTAESPEHDHPRYRETMRWYYPFVPGRQHLMRAWKRPATGRAEFAWSGGHRLLLPQARIAPDLWPMKHYLCLSREHLARKYRERRFVAAELARGWHGWRARVDPAGVVFPAQAELRAFCGDAHLDPERPRVRHVLDDLAGAHVASAASD